MTIDCNTLNIYLKYVEEIKILKNEKGIMCEKCG